MPAFDPHEATRQAIKALSPDSFEQLAYSVLRVQYPQIRALRAPDGGADLIEDGPPKRVWQVKHTETVNWSECEISLRSAIASHSPDELTFVFPVDLTVRQNSSYERLRLQARPVVLGVLGFRWFDSEFDRPELAGLRQHLLVAPRYSLVPESVAILHPPVMPSFWIPRTQLLADIDSWWREGSENVLALVGIGGSGKSTLINSWLDRLRASTPDSELDGVLQFSLYEHGDKTFRDFLAATIRTLGTPIGTGDEVELLVDSLATRKVLLVLDGAERLLREYSSAAPELVEERESREIASTAREVVDETAWRFLNALASRPLSGRLVLTSRLMPTDFDSSRQCRTLDLDRGLSGPEAASLLRALQVGIHNTDAEVHETAASLGGHPLSLARLGNVLRADPVSPGDVRRAPRYSERLSVRRRRRDIFDRAFEFLHQDARRALFLLAAARGPVAGPDFQALGAAANISVSGETSRMLVDEMWATQDDAGALRLHPVARRWLSAKDNDSRRTHLAHANRWRPRADALDLAAVDELANPQISDVQPATELVFHLARAGEYDEAYKRLDGQLSRALAGRLFANAYRSELLLEFFPGRREEDKPLLTDPRQHGSLYNSLANDFALTGQPARAIPLLERAVGLASSDSQQSLGVRLGNLALTRIRVGQLRGSSEELQRQLTVGEGCSDRTNVLVAMQELARLEAFCGRHDQASPLLDSADGIIDELMTADDTAFESCSPIGWTIDQKRRYVRSNRRSLGASYRVQLALLAGRDSHSLALSAYQIALGTKEPRAVRRARTMLGLSLLATDQCAEARDVFEGLLAALRGPDLLDARPELLIGLGQTWLSEDRPRTAQLAELADREAYRNGNRLQRAEASLLSARASQGERSHQYARQALDLAWCDGPPFWFDAVIKAANALLAAGS